MRSIDLMRKREDAIGELVLHLSDKSEGFTQPKLVVIGGYALRAFIPFSRYSRDCDFVLEKGLETIKGWIPEDVTIEAIEQKEDYGFMRWAKILGEGKQKIRLGLDFLEGQVRGRDDEAFTIDDEFLARSTAATLEIGSQTCEVFVPAYEDFFLLKVMASRSSDIRDIAALVHENGAPRSIRLEVLADPSIFVRNLEEKVIPEIEHQHFINSWNGMFVGGNFEEDDRQIVRDSIKALLTRNPGGSGLHGGTETHGD